MNLNQTLSLLLGCQCVGLHSNAEVSSYCMDYHNGANCTRDLCGTHDHTYRGTVVFFRAHSQVISSDSTLGASNGQESY